MGLRLRFWGVTLGGAAAFTLATFDGWQRFRSDWPLALSGLVGYAIVPMLVSGAVAYAMFKPRDKETKP